MARVHRSSSKIRALMMMGLAASSLVACASVSELRLSTLGIGNEVVASPDLELKPTVLADEGAIKIKRGKRELEAVVVPAGKNAETSAWCESMREDSAAQAAIMNSPSLSGSIDDESKSSISLSMSGSSYLKSKLLKEAAEVRCRRYLAESELQKLIFVSPQGLTSAGFKAKAKAINSKKSEISAVRRAIKVALQAGDIDQAEAASIGVMADALMAEANAATSQAARRLEAVATPTGSAAVLSQELLAAEAELEDINSRMRTLDAVDVSASVGWSDDISTDGFNADAESFNGKVSFNIKLGALTPKRYEHERRSREAKLRAISGEEGGALWQVATLRRAHERAISGLVQQKAEIGSAISKTEKLARDIESTGSPEFIAALSQARLQLIRLQADRDAVAGSIDEIQANLEKLKAS